MAKRPAHSAGLDRLVRRVDAVVCSASAEAEVRAVATDTVPVIVDDRALDPRAVAMLAAVLVGYDGDGMPVEPPRARKRATVPPRRTTPNVRLQGERHRG